jgi:hypothetical protein
MAAADVADCAEHPAVRDTQRFRPDRPRHRMTFLLSWA